MNLIKEYENMVKNTTYLFGRLNSFTEVMPYKKSTIVVSKFTKPVTPSPKISTTSSRVALQKSLIVIPASPKISTTQPQSSASLPPPSSKASALPRRFSRLLLSPL